MSLIFFINNLMFDDNSSNSKEFKPTTCIFLFLTFIDTQLCVEVFSYLYEGIDYPIIKRVIYKGTSCLIEENDYMNYYWL